MSLVAIVMVAAALPGFDPGSARGAEVPCATKRLYGQRLGVFLVDGDITCAAVRRIIRGPCRDGRIWSCTSFRTPDPVLFWYRTRERFAPFLSMAIARGDAGSAEAFRPAARCLPTTCSAAGGSRG
jgi:hypothetical protein